MIGCLPSFLEERKKGEHAQIVTQAIDGLIDQSINGYLVLTVHTPTSPHTESVARPGCSVTANLTEKSVCIVVYILHTHTQHLLECITMFYTP